MEKIITSAKEGSYEAMEALFKRASNNRMAHHAFFRIMEDNLRVNTDSIQARLPLVPSLDPKDVINLSCTSILALATGLRNRHLLQPTCLADSRSSIAALLPSISFWLCFFCEHIILPSRTPEFKLIDFHHVVVFMLAWATDQNEIILEPKFFTDYLPFLWFHPPAGYTKYNRNDAQSVFATVYNAVFRCESAASREALIGRLEENSTLTASLIVQFIMDEFSHIPEASDMRDLYLSFLTVTVFALELSTLSLSIHAALLENNSMQWMSLILRFVTQRVRFTHTTLLMATDCASRCLPYILRAMQDGHSYIHRLLGYDVLLYMFKAFHNLHAHPNLIDQELKELQTSMENDAVEILFMVASHCYYASILKRSKKATFKIQRRHLDDFVDSSSEPVSRIWTWLVDIVSNRPDISKSLDSLCGSKQCPRTSVGEFMTCSGCQFTLYCSRTCQKDDWSSGDHRSLCKKIKQLRIDGRPLPMFSSDERVIEMFTFRRVRYLKENPAERDKLVDKYIAENGHHDPLCPLVLMLDYCTPNVDLHMVSSEQLQVDPGVIASVQEHGGTFVFWNLPDGKRVVRRTEVVFLSPNFPL